MKTLIVSISIFSLMFLDCCKTVTNIVESGGALLDSGASPFVVTKKRHFKGVGSVLTVRLTTRNDKRLLQITDDSMPMVQFYATETDSQGSFALTGMRFLAGNYGGWNEFFCEASGAGLMRSSSFEIADPVQVGAMTRGAIQRDAARMSGDAALENLKNRQERIAAVTEWMKEQPAMVFKNLAAFEAYWQPKLLPEVVKAKLRPDLYITINENSTKDDYVFAEDVRFNRAYTAAYFPEALRPLRDSGALLRDWEEAAAWFYLDYSWDNFLQSLYQEKEAS
jgi:hypothetical protein